MIWHTTLLAEDCDKGNFLFEDSDQFRVDPVEHTDLSDNPLFSNQLSIVLL